MTCGKDILMYQNLIYCLQNNNNVYNNQNYLVNGLSFTRKYDNGSRQNQNLSQCIFYIRYQEKAEIENGEECYQCLINLSKYQGRKFTSLYISNKFY